MERFGEATFLKPHPARVGVVITKEPATLVLIRQTVPRRTLSVMIEDVRSQSHTGCARRHTARPARQGSSRQKGARHDSRVPNTELSEHGGPL